MKPQKQVRGFSQWIFEFTPLGSGVGDSKEDRIEDAGREVGREVPVVTQS